MPYDVVDATQWAVAGLETDGKTEHMWLERPGDQRPWLFKAAVSHGDRRQGEDWVEKVASVVAQAVGVPRADVEMARRGDVAGCVVRDLKPHQWQWYSGADLLTGCLGGDFNPRDRRARGHRLDVVQRVLEPYEAPVPLSQQGLTAFDCFAGYLLLDALIANRDRHPRNWAVMQPPAGRSGADTLTPSFDHASGLGFSLTDTERDRWLRQFGVAAWAGRGTAKSFEHGAKPWPTLVELAVVALRSSRPAARVHWRSQVEGLTEGRRWAPWTTCRSCRRSRVRSRRR